MPLSWIVPRFVFLKSRIILNTIITHTKMPFYAVARGRTTGIFMTWPDCEAQVKGFPGARYKKFDTVVSAQDFITTEGGASKSTNNGPSKSTVKRKSTGFAEKSQRNYSTSSNFKTSLPSGQSKKNSKTQKNGDNTDDSSDDSDDLNAMICKQMDDIEKRLNNFEKGVDKIIKKGSKQTILIEPPQKKSKSGGDSSFDVDSDGFVNVYTDGACSSNGKNGARAGLGVYWGDGHPLNLSEPVSGRATNNCGEIQAATQAIKMAIQNKISKLCIHTDSKFLINSVTKWIPGWKRKGWKLASGEPVKNERDFKDLDSVQHKLQIKWNYVEAHKGVHGNEMADQLAKNGATMYKNYIK